jgi:hypothetical protein
MLEAVPHARGVLMSHEKTIVQSRDRQGADPLADARGSVRISIFGTENGKPEIPNLKTDPERGTWEFIGARSGPMLPGHYPDRQMRSTLHSLHPMVRIPLPAL